MLDDSIKASLAQASKQHLLSLIEAQRKKLQSLDAIREVLGDGQMTRAELVQRARELARDAERYRYLRDAEIGDWSRDFVAACLCDHGGDMTEVKGEALDAAVDAQMGRERK